MERRRKCIDPLDLREQVLERALRANPLDPNRQDVLAPGQCKADLARNVT